MSFQSKKLRGSNTQKSSECPTELKTMIELVRIVPPHLSLMPIKELFAREISEERERNPGGIFHYIFAGRDEVYLERIIRRQYPNSSNLDFIETRIKHTPQDFRDYILSPADNMTRSDLTRIALFLEDGSLIAEAWDSYRFIKCMARYTNFYDVRSTLTLFVELLEFERAKFNLTKVKDCNLFSMPVNVTIRRESDGRLHLTGIAKLIEDGFDEDRLRKCKKCGHIFWAKRSDSKTCSKKCLNAYNVQQYRKLTDEQKNERKVKRDANRELVKNNKAKAVKRNKSNGTL